jgi:hypothetical protein
MQHGQILSHEDTDLVTREQLALVETPDPTRSFKPVPHIELIDTLDKVLRQNQIAIRKEQFALRRDGSTLFGVHADTEDGVAAIGLRTARNKTMSIQICAGLSVLVCDNLVFRGDRIALNRKHNLGSGASNGAVNRRNALSGALRPVDERNIQAQRAHAHRCRRQGDHP